MSDRQKRGRTSTSAPSACQPDRPQEPAQAFRWSQPAASQQGHRLLAVVAAGGGRQGAYWYGFSRLGVLPLLGFSVFGAVQVRLERERPARLRPLPSSALSASDLSAGSSSL